MIPEPDREFFFDPQITADYVHSKIPMPSIATIKGKINIVQIIDIAAKGKGYNISDDDKQHARMIYTRKTDGMDLQKEKPGITTELLISEKINEIYGSIPTTFISGED